MEDLAGYRREIDEIDSQLIPLFERRMDVVRGVARYKKARDLPVLQQDRERVVLEKAVARLRDPGYAAEAERFMNAVMAISRAAQRRDIGGALPREAAPLAGRVGYYGAPGSFSEQALADYFGEDRTVDTHIKMLRSHLGRYRDAIVTVWGIGYKFDPDAVK